MCLFYGHKTFYKCCVNKYENLYAEINSLGILVVLFRFSLFLRIDWLLDLTVFGMNV